MSEPYQMFVLMTTGISPMQAITQTHASLEAAGGSLADDDCFLQLNDLPCTDAEQEPKPISNVSEALERLWSWPTLGFLEYLFAPGTATVAFHNLYLSGPVHVVKVSIWQRTFESGGTAAAQAAQDLAQALHKSLGAARTVMDWGLEHQGFSWQEEIKRLQVGVIRGSYQLVDLRSDVLPAGRG